MKQMRLFDVEEEKFISLKQASRWASEYLKREITISNISYLIQYGRIKKYGINGNVYVNKNELKKYYDGLKKNEDSLKNKLGSELNWRLSFVEYKEAERTKHVHRLHPYKGKFIPQLVEYFLDDHIDEYKKEVFFYKGDIVLDPFCGSGTTLVQANELGIHAIGIDISQFNVLISNVKISKYNLSEILSCIKEITHKLENFQSKNNNIEFENELMYEINKFNNTYFPVPEYKQKIRNIEINEFEYGKEKAQEFKKIYEELIRKYKIKVRQDSDKTFLDKWFLYPVRLELNFLLEEIKKIDNKNIREVLFVILSRTARSCRATTHSDLATLKKPVYGPYYCKKHSKICKPLFSVIKWWKKYSEDTLKRLSDFERIKTDTKQICLVGDSRRVEILKELKQIDNDFYELVKAKKIAGVFSSPPYVGLINYHEQHAYAYELFGFKRNDELEIGPLFNGKGKEARESYVKGISDVLINIKKYLKEDYNIFLVANDKFNLYPEIARISNMRIVNKFQRPVLNRVEKDRNPYFESIFHLKENK